MSQKTTIGNYLLRRLKELGVDIIFGLPGDYNLVSQMEKIERKRRYLLLFPFF